MKIKLIERCQWILEGTRRLCGLGLGAAIVLGSLSAAHGQTQPAAGGPTAGPTHAQYALGLLKPVADKLSAAKALRFKVDSMVEVTSPVGHMLNYFFNTEVEAERPNKLFARKRGDGPAFDVYYDGKKFSGVDEKLGLYAEMEAPATLDELIPAVMEKTGMYFPFADVLYSDVYGKITKDLTHAYWVDKSIVAGVECDHLAFAGPGIEWQLWVGPATDPLPRRLAVTYVGMERQPRFLVTFSDWDLNPARSGERFEFKKPADAKAIEFRPLMGKEK
jgi:hypothetical protein